jgi:hypothetical protein
MSSTVSVKQAKALYAKAGQNADKKSKRADGSKEKAAKRPADDDDDEDEYYTSTWGKGGKEATAERIREGNKRAAKKAKKKNMTGGGLPADVQKLVDSRKERCVAVVPARAHTPDARRGIPCAPLRANADHAATCPFLSSALPVVLTAVLAGC